MAAACGASSARAISRERSGSSSRQPPPRAAMASGAASGGGGDGARRARRTGGEARHSSEEKKEEEMKRSAGNAPQQRRRDKVRRELAPYFWRTRMVERARDTFGGCALRMFCGCYGLCKNRKGSENIRRRISFVTASVSHRLIEPGSVRRVAAATARPRWLGQAARRQQTKNRAKERFNRMRAPWGKCVCVVQRGRG